MGATENGRDRSVGTSQPLAPGEVVLWLLEPSTATSEDHRHWYDEWLDDAERQRADQAGTAARRAELIAGRALLRVALASHFGRGPCFWRCVATPRGRPHLDPALAVGPTDGLELSLAHTRGLVACVLGSGVRVGVDVERSDRRVEPSALAERFFSRHDADAVAGAPAEVRGAVFLVRWTLREAYTKVLGTPLLALPRQSVSFEPDGSGPRGPMQLTRDSERASESWRFWTLEPTPAHVVAVAALAASGRVATDLAIRYWRPSRAA